MVSRHEEISLHIHSDLDRDETSRGDRDGTSHGDAGLLPVGIPTKDRRHLREEDEEETIVGFGMGRPGGTRTTGHHRHEAGTIVGFGTDLLLQDGIPSHRHEVEEVPTKGRRHEEEEETIDGFETELLLQVGMPTKGHRREEEEATIGGFGTDLLIPTKDHRREEEAIGGFGMDLLPVGIPTKDHRREEATSGGFETDLPLAGIPTKDHRAEVMIGGFGTDHTTARLVVRGMDHRQGEDHRMPMDNDPIDRLRNADGEKNEHCCCCARNG